LIVCSQSTKRLAISLGSGGDGVSDFDVSAGDDYAVDKQFEQLSLSVEVCPLQALPHALAEQLGMSREVSGFGPAIGIVREVAFPAFECQQPAFSVLPATLVLAERDHAGQIGLGQPLDLLIQARPGTA
jgi:hypothetical protein